MRKAAAGVNQLNTALQALLNPADPRKAELLLGRMGSASSEGDSSLDGSPGVIRQGDRVIQTSNNYQKDVFNGDFGFVATVDRAERELVVKFPGKSLCSLRWTGKCAELHASVYWSCCNLNAAMPHHMQLGHCSCASDLFAYVGFPLNAARVQS